MKHKAAQQCMKLGIGFILAIALSLPVTSSRAASENRAQVIKDSYCFEYEGSTICYDNLSVFTETTTPSGNTTFMGTGWAKYSQTDPSGVIVYQDSLSGHTQGLIKETVLFEYGQFFTYSVAVGDATCTINFAYHLVNDEVQFERSTTCG
jgi:hypothetical protein